MERGIRRTYTWFYLPDDVFSNLTSKPMNRPVKFFLHNVNAATRTGNCDLFLRSNEPGGARRDRTDDLMLAKHALSQLSYGPTFAPYDVGEEPLEMSGANDQNRGVIF